MNLDGGANTKGFFFFFLKDLCSIFLSQCEQEFSVVAPESRKLQLCCTSHMFGRSEHRECGKKFALNIKLEMEKVIMTKKKILSSRNYFHRQNEFQRVCIVHAVPLLAM